jgi:hypothetical protein
MNLPMWQRLPSRNLSFQSAEILTVTECSLENLSLYANRSVRVTGCILERLVHGVSDNNNDSMIMNNDNDMVSLVLSDPLAALPLSRNALRRRSMSLGGNTNNPGTRRVSFPKTPSSRLNKIQHTGNTTLTKRTPGTGTHTRTILRRKSVGLLGGDGVTVTPGLATTSRKRPLSGAFQATTNPEDALVHALSSTNNYLWVLVNPQHVSVTHSTTGDLVMAMGEIREYNEQDSDLPLSIHKIAARIRATQQPRRQTQTGQKEVEPETQQQPQDPNSHRPIYFLQTRILRNANGTNMTLHTEALYARRQQLVAPRLRQQSTSATDQDASAPCVVWPGCGPPPYKINEVVVD